MKPFRRIDPKHRKKMVYLTGRVPNRGPSKLWAFGYEDFALLFGTSVDAVRQMVSRGQFNPGDLLSVCKLWMSKNQ